MICVRFYLFYYYIPNTYSFFHTAAAVERMTRFNAPLRDTHSCCHCCRFNLKVIEYCRWCTRERQQRRRCIVSITPLIVYFCIFLSSHRGTSLRASERHIEVCCSDRGTDPGGGASLSRSKFYAGKIFYDILYYGLNSELGSCTDLHSGPRCTCRSRKPITLQIIKHCIQIRFVRVLYINIYYLIPLRIHIEHVVRYIDR